MRTSQLPAIKHDVLAHMGMHIEGPGTSDSDGLVGRYWWSWYRDGWGGIECGPDFATHDLAEADAWDTLLHDPEFTAELTALGVPLASVD